ncbi:MAG: MFS transporter [Candidatus Bathyarchaeia archaeon]
MALERGAANAFRVLLLCVFIAMIGLGIISPIIPNYASSMGATGLMIGLIYSSFSLSRAVLQAPMGRLSDSVSKKKIIIVGLTAYTVTSILYTRASSPEMLIYVRLFHGVGSAMVMPVAMAYAMELTPKGKEGRYMGYLNTAIFAGYGAGPMLGGFLYENYSANMAFNAMSVMVFLSLVVTAALVPDEMRLGLHRGRVEISLRSILANKKLSGTFVYRMVNALGRGTIMGFLPLFAVQVLGISGTLVGLILSFGIFANALLQTPMGALADRYNKNLLLIAGGLVSSLGYFYMIHAGNSVELFLSRLVISAGGALSIPALTAIVAEEGKMLGSGSTVGIYNTAMSLGQIVGPVFTGFLLDRYGMGAVFNFTGLIGFVSVAAFYLLSR